MPPTPTLFGRVQGQDNTQLSVVIETFGKDVLDLILESFPNDQLPNFPSPIMTIEVSADDGINWTLVDRVPTMNLPGNAISFRYFSENSRNTSQIDVIQINPTLFPKIRVIVPALGTGFSSIVSWALH